MTKTSAEKLATLLFGTKLDRKLSKEDYREKISEVLVNNEGESIKITTKVEGDWIGPGSTWTKDMDMYIDTFQPGRFANDEGKRYLEVRTEKGSLFFPPAAYKIINPLTDGTVDRIVDALYLQDAEYELAQSDFVQLLNNI